MHVEVRNLSKRYGGVRVFTGASAAFPAGKITVLLGANGSGKTTLLRCLTGLCSPDAGEVLLDGEPLSAGRLDLRRRLLFLPDFPPFLPDADPLTHTAACLRIWEADRPGVEDRVAAWLADLHLAESAATPCDRLSRGQAYKAALLALLAVDPGLWLLDEPFASGMDASGLRVLRDEALAAARRGRTVICTTQLVEIAAAFSDCVVLVGNGTLTLHDTEAEFGRDPARVESALRNLAWP